KATAGDGCFMPDPFQYICYVFTLLVTYVCNLPEASMIAAVSKNSSPLTMAIQEQFGDGILHPYITTHSKAVNLSGVHMPYWRDWLFTCLSVFLAGEVLHTGHKIFTNHPLKWIKEAIGTYELNTRFIIQHKCFRMCHFMKGITHVKQMTGHEHRDIQCAIVASIAGAASPRFVHAICVLVDFIYLAQNPV
ncbi:hypothetical protein DEU56DRAFT_692623, partial [Suillus clintonianus]|uniref:uncharacterized protein n=1 Tax=Suillus clintonianus TaxID=1904413 RepID=UPI001B869575